MTDCGSRLKVFSVAFIVKSFEYYNYSTNSTDKKKKKKKTNATLNDV